MSWKDFKVGKKLTIGFGMMIILIIIAGAVGFQGIQSIGNALFTVGDEEAPLVDMANEMKISLWASRTALEEYKGAAAAMATDDKDALDGILETYRNTVEDFDTYYGAIIDGGIVGDMTVLKTDNPELAKLVHDADTVHNEKFQASAALMIEEGIKLLKGKETLDIQMADMEDVFNEVISDSDNVEHMISSEIDLRSSRASLSGEALAILREEVPLHDMVNELKISLSMTRVILEEYTQMTSLSELADLDEDYAHWIDVFDQKINAILNGGTVNGKKIIATDNRQIRNAIEELDSDHTEFQANASGMMEAQKNLVLQSEAAQQAMEELDRYGDEAASLLDEVETLAGIEMANAKLNGAKAKSISIIVLLAVIIVSIILGVIIGIVIARGITRPLQKGMAFAQALSGGDLTAQIDLDQKDEVGLLANALKDMVFKLKSVISDALSGSEQIASASEQLSSGNQDLSNRTEQQATALEETSSAIEEMNSSIRSNADNTGTANQLSNDALTKTADGSEAVSTMIVSMNEISTSSNRIADIIEVINNIAFQTNLLALNASIEAARAGEMGKGFAVVAVEVRKLAKRSDKAAAEIAAIIKDSNKKVDEGVEIANNAGSVLTDINSSVKKVTALVGEISAASQEQLSSVDQIDKTLSSLDENTQKNAALVEEAASSTEELSAQAQELSTNMSFFRINNRDVQKSTALKKEVTSVRLLDEPEKSREKTLVMAGKGTDTYEAFSNLADEEEFAEF